MGAQELPRRAPQGGGRRSGKLIRWDSEHAGEIAGWKDAAHKGHEWAVDKLLSRPTLSKEAARYMAAFQLLSRDRPEQSIAMGLAGGIMVPRPIPLREIRSEARRQGLAGEALDEFVGVLMAIDGIYLEVEVIKIGRDAQRALQRSRNKR